MNNRLGPSNIWTVCPFYCHLILLTFICDFYNQWFKENVKIPTQLKVKEYLINSNMEEFLYIVQELPQIHYKADDQGKSWIHADHVLLLKRDINHPLLISVIETIQNFRKKVLTISKSKTRYQIVFIKGRHGSSDDRYGLLVRVRWATSCMEAFPVERMLSYRHDWVSWSDWATQT